jgi:hypothetical protein
MLSPPWGEHKRFILEKSCGILIFLLKTMFLMIYF